MGRRERRERRKLPVSTRNDLAGVSFGVLDDGCVMVRVQDPAGTYLEAGVRGSDFIDAVPGIVEKIRGKGDVTHDMDAHTNLRNLRELTHEEAKVCHPSRTGSVAESMRLQNAFATGKARLVDGIVVEDV